MNSLSFLLIFSSIIVLVASIPVQGNFNDNAYVWGPVDDALNNAMAEKAFPGCVAIVGTKGKMLYAKSFGSFTYGVPPPNNNDNPPMQLDTMFDMASCTKVFATTTSIAQFYQRGELDLDVRVADILGSDFAVNGKYNITVRNCLLHNSGFPSDPFPGYAETPFGCPNTKDFHPAEDFSCQAQIHKSQMNQSLLNPIGAVYLYSDLNFMTLMHVVGSLAMKYNYITPKDLIPGCDQGGPQADQCYYEAYVRKYVIEPLGVNDTQFLPHQSLWSRCAPTLNDTTYRHSVVQGMVEDPNTYADGGISGHAGLYSTGLDVFAFMQKLMYSTENDSYLNSTTYQYFIKEYNHTQSSRALGWNTNDPNVFDEGWNQSCGSLSPTTFMHTGYTGQMICGDPVRELFVVLLTNRIYPYDEDWKIKIVRQQFSTAVQKVYDANFVTDNLIKQNTGYKEHKSSLNT